MSDDKQKELFSFRIDDSTKNEVHIFSDGYEVARWQPGRGWQLHVNKEWVALEETLRRVSQLQATLSKVAFNGTE